MIQNMLLSTTNVLYNLSCSRTTYVYIYIYIYTYIYTYASIGAFIATCTYVAMHAYLTNVYMYMRSYSSNNSNI